MNENDKSQSKQSVSTHSAKNNPSACGNISNMDVLNALQSINSNLSNVSSVLCHLVTQQQQQQRPQPYTAQHGASTTVQQQRFDPTKLPINVAAPPIIPLPYTFETNLPSLGNDKEEND